MITQELLFLLTSFSAHSYFWFSLSDVRFLVFMQGASGHPYVDNRYPLRFEDNRYYTEDIEGNEKMVYVADNFDWSMQPGPGDFREPDDTRLTLEIDAGDGAKSSNIIVTGRYFSSFTHCWVIRYRYRGVNGSVNIKANTIDHAMYHFLSNFRSIVKN